MTPLKDLLEDLNACSDAKQWVGDMTIEEAVQKCHRGDWLLWLSQKIDIGLQPLTLAKGHCANTVRHLMKDERSTKAVDAAIAFGEGKITIEELHTYASAASAYADAASAYADADAARAAADAAYAARAASAYADAADASAYASSYAARAAAAYARADAYASDAYASAKKENQMMTADVCRKYIDKLIIDKVNEIIVKNK